MLGNLGGSMNLRLQQKLSLSSFMRVMLRCLCSTMSRILPMLVFVTLGSLGAMSFAQTGVANGVPPGPDANCTVTAMNRTAPLQSDYSFTIYNIPGAATAVGPQNIGNTTPAPPFRVRAVCSDGTVGETDLAFPEFGSTVVYTGEIFWRPATPVPLAVSVTAAQNKLSANQTTQLRTIGVLANAATVDLTGRDKGTLYTSSNPLIATVNEAGLASVVAQFANGAASRVVVTGQNEGVAASTVLQIGPRGQLSGRIFHADGVTPVAGAHVTVIRNQPRESLGTVTTDASGNYSFEDVSAGSFSVSVIDPTTGDLGRGEGALQTEGQTSSIDIRLNGQGTVRVTVLNGAGAPVSNASVTFTSLSGYRDLRTLPTDSAGQVVLERALAGQFTVSTRDTATNLVGTALGLLPVGGTANVTLQLQPVGAIAGTVYGADGASAQAGIQVRLVSAGRGIVTQLVTGEDGKFRFDALPLSDSPFTLDAMQNGRLRARVPGIILTGAGQERAQNIVFAPAGMVSGVVTRNDGGLVEGATVTVQSLVGQRFAFSTKSDAQGRYMIDGVPAGAFGLTASAGNGEVGSAGGSINADGESIQINLQLAANGIVGTVFNRDGVTPVGAGVNVALNPGSVTTQTNAQGQYGFTVTQPATYTIEAADANGNRGRSSVALTAITPGDPRTVNVVFLARGSVQGSVRDPSGNIQPGVPVTLTSSSLFGGTLTTTSDNEGRYRFDGVFIGEFSVYARNGSTNLAGVGRGRLAEENEVVTADVTLAATGSVSGRVLAQDNVTPVAGAQIEFNIAGTAALRTTANADGNFTFSVVPLGDFSLIATNPANGDKGQVVSRLVTLNEARTVNIRLLGQGSVHVRAIDGANKPVQGVAVTATSGSQFGGTYKGVTDAEGLVTFSPVFNGDVSVSGERGAGTNRVSGFASTTVVNGGTATVTLTLLNKPVGALAGVVTKGLASAPQAGVTVRLQNLNTGEQRSTVTSAEGAYAFDLVEVGPSYRVTAVVNDRVRARVDVSLSVANETLTRDLVLIGVGSVSGRATNAQNQAQAGILVTVSNPDPTYGGTWGVTTQADGSYSLANIPAGNFTVRARSNDGRLQAQNSGIIRFDADAAIVNLTLVDNAVNLPINLYDANGTRFDFQGDGSVAQGTNNVFNGNGNADVRASRLEIVVNNTGVPFQNGDGTIGRLTQLGQLLEVDDFHQASGLDITRRIYVPKNGYFARTLEVLENRTANPITVGVKVVSNIAPGVAGARVVDTSSNDSVLDVSADASRDRWVILDDDRDSDPFESQFTENPSVAFVFDGTNASAKVAEAGVTAVGTVAKVAWQWSNVTIQPGASVAVMHFASQQLGRIPARAAAERLAQLPPEALEGLTSDERAIILNFKVPADGLSALAPLPAVEGTNITGTVYAGDGTTPIAGAHIALKSENVLYGRSYDTYADSNGQFTFNSQHFGQSNVVAIAQDRFTATATHPHTNAKTAPAAGVFTAGQASLVQDLVFIGTGNLTGTVKRHTGAAVTGGTVSIPYRFPGNTSIQALTTNISSSGTFTYTGITPGDYLATATQGHPQGQALSGSATGPVGVPDGTTTVVAITMEETGEVTGTVRAANGEPVVNANVQLDPSYYGPYRSTQTDTGGTFRFTDVRLGSHTVQASGSNGLQESATTTVVKDTAAVVNLQLAGTGQVNVQVNYQRGAAAVNAYVELVGRNGGYSNGGGQVSFSAPSDLPLTLRARHPDNWDLMVEGTATIVGNGGTANLALTLPPAGSVTGTLLRPDGSTPAAGVSVVLRRQDGTVYQRSTSTNASGLYRFDGLPLAPYSVSAEDRATFKFAHAETTVTADGQEATVNLQLADNRVALPSDLRDANDFLFDIQQNGSIGAGWRARSSSSYGVYQSGAAQLEINGQNFSGDVGAFLEAGRRQFAITQPTSIAGLNVTRKVFVPRGGYFARYLEILENPSAAAITVGVKLKSRYRSSNNFVAATSSGDTDLQATGAQRDTWVMLDDSRNEDPFLTESPPATAIVLGGGDSGLPHDQLSLDYSSNIALHVGWSNVTVPAGSRVALMHFQVQQVSREGARAAAERLQQLPPEALDALTGEEIAAISNFSVPSNGQSAVAALPSLLGAVSGQVYEGNATTVVPNASIMVRSSHPLFGRTWMRANWWPCDTSVSLPTLLTTATGAFSLSGRLQDQGSIPLPVGSDIHVQSADARCSNWNEVPGHPLTRVPSPAFTASFADGATQAVRNIVFDTGILTGTVTGPSDYSAAGGSVTTTLPANTNVSGNYSVSVSVANDGTYVLPGMPAGTRTLTSAVPHNQGTGLLGNTVDVNVVSGQTLVADIAIEATGSVTGVVVTANGEAAVSSSITLVRNDSRYVYRSTSTDSLGRFNFSAVPVGQYTLAVTDSRTGAITSAVVNVTQNQVTTQSLTLVGTGAVQVTVNYARGTVAPDVDVYLQSSAVGGSFQYKGRTDAQGRLNVLVPVGTYTFRVVHPLDGYYSGRWIEANGTIATNNESQQLTMALTAHTAVRVTVLDQDNGNAPVASARVILTDSACPSGCDMGTTNGSGQRLLTNVHEGNYTITVRTQQGRVVQMSGVINASNDGQTLERTLNLTTSTDKLGVFTYVSERHLYSIAANANDVINVSIAGASVNGGPSEYLTNVQVYNPEKSVVAEGYGYDSRNSYSQYNAYGNLQQIVAGTAGNYTIAVNPYYSTASYLGGYRLHISVNGTAVEIPAYLDGGTVQGTLLRANGSAAAEHYVQIDTHDVLRLSTRVQTDSSGAYQFSGVPVGDFTVRAMEPINKTVLVTSTGSVTAVNEVVTKDLRLPPTSTLQVQVSIPGSLLVPSQLYFTVTDFNGSRQEGPVTFAAGERVSSARTAVVVGEQVTVRVVHPNNSVISATSVVTGIEGESIPVMLTLSAGSVRGTVRDATGAAVPSQYVEALDSTGDRYFGGTYTDSQGNFFFEVLPTGEEVRLAVQEPNSYVLTFAAVSPQAGETVTRDIQMVGFGTVSGVLRTTTGTVIPNTEVHATYVYNSMWNWTTSRSGYTNAAGEFSIGGLPVGQPISLSAQINLGFTSVTANGSVTLNSHGESATANVEASVPGAGLFVQVVDAENQPVSISCQRVEVQAQNGQNAWRNWIDCGQGTLFGGLSAGDASVSGRLDTGASFGPVAATAVDGQITNAKVKVSLVRGVVRFADGTAVNSPSVRFTDSTGTTYYAQTNEHGEYRFYGAPVGEFNVRAEDYDSGLSASAAGNLLDPDTAVALDIALPASGTVTGVFRNRNNEPIAHAEIYVLSSAADTSRYMSTDANGVYRFERVAVGTITVLARRNGSSLVSTATGQLNAAGAKLSLDLNEAPSTTISGRVLNEAGTPVADALVEFSTVETYGPFGTLAWSTATDASGNYSFTNVPLGELRLMARDSSVAGFVNVTTVADTALTQDIVIGGAVYMPRTFNSPDTSRYDVQCDGSLGDGGYAGRGDAYDGTYYLQVDGTGFPCISVAEASMSGRQVVLGPMASSNGIQATRRIYVPAAGGYARYLEVLHNPTAADITVPVRVTGNLGSDSGTQLVISPAQTSGRYAVTTDSGYDPALGHVFAGAGAPLVGTQSFNPPSDNISFGWNVTVPASGTVSLLHFAIQRAALDSSAVQAQAEALSNMTQPGMFDGLTTTDKANIKNFLVSQ